LRPSPDAPLGGTGKGVAVAGEADDEDRRVAGFAQIHPAEFHSAAGVGDWRVLYWGAHAFYRTNSFAEAAQFVAAIADAAASVKHDPDVDVRPEGVTIRTCSRRDGALSRQDAELAAAVSEAAHRMGLQSDPAALQVVGIAVAQDAGVDTRPFWEAAFGYRRVGDVDLVDPLRRGPHLWFHDLTDPRPGRGRTHIDVSVPAQEAEKRVRAAVSAGGRIVDDSRAPRWWTIASPENHGVDIAGWTDFEV
jgi:4a-hydroxytetrahydrobiopterin dehydratase